jgi:hypothetical protein
MEIEYKNKRLIIQYSIDRAEKDKKEREKNIEKILKKK